MKLSEKDIPKGHCQLCRKKIEKDNLFCEKCRNKDWKKRFLAVRRVDSRRSLAWRLGKKFEERKVGGKKIR